MQPAHAYMKYLKAGFKRARLQTVLSGVKMLTQDRTCAAVTRLGISQGDSCPEVQPEAGMYWLVDSFSTVARLARKLNVQA